MSIDNIILENFNKVDGIVIVDTTTKFNIESILVESKVFHRAMKTMPPSSIAARAYALLTRLEDMVTLHMSDVGDIVEHISSRVESTRILRLRLELASRDCESVLAHSLQDIII